MQKTSGICLTQSHASRTGSHKSLIEFKSDQKQQEKEVFSVTRGFKTFR